MANKEVKIIVADTNWWISLAIKKFQNNFVILLRDKSLEFCSCKELEDEIQSTINKKRLQKYFDQNLLEQFWTMYHFSVREVAIVSTVDICRDSNDNFLLALAKDAKADFLITGDKDLLEIGQFETTIICTLTTFIETHYPKIQ